MGLWQGVAISFGNGENRHQISHRVLMNRDDVTPIPRRRSVFKKQAADVEVCQAVGKVAAADLKQIRPSCDDGGQLAETLDESFGRGLQLGDIGIVRNSEKNFIFLKSNQTR